MKRLKGRILLGTTAVAAALTITGCTANQNANSGAESSTESAAHTATTIKDFEKKLQQCRLRSAAGKVTKRLSNLKKKVRRFREEQLC